MTRTRALGAVFAATLVFTACSGGGGQAARDAASAEGSALESGVKAPPVPKEVQTTTSVPATGSTYYVDPKGKDSATGTKQEPFKTVSRGVGKLKAGDTLLIQPGSYAEGQGNTGVLIKDMTGTADKPITIAAASSVKPKITGGEWKTISIEKSSYLVLRGIETEGTAAVDKKPTSGVEILESHHITVSDSYVHDGGGGGIGSIRSNHIDILRNYISGMSKWNPYQTSGISLFESMNVGGEPGADGYSMHIVGNTVYGTENIALPVDGGNAVTDGNCIIVDTGDDRQYLGKTYVANNVCSNNGGRGVHVFKSGNVVAVNNTLYHNVQTAQLKDDGGELSAITAHDVVFRNNLVIARDERKATSTYRGSAITFESNLYQRDGGSPHDKDRAVTDVGLTAPDAGDFSLKAGSAAIDAGLATDAPTIDNRGVKRSGKPDIGAFEAAS